MKLPKVNETELESLAKIIDLIGIGNVVFWGFVVFGIFNNIITRAILTNGKNK